VTVASPVMSASHVLRLDGLAHGGEAVGRLASGKACFVGYAVPGELVRVELTEDHPRWARGRLVEVLEPSPDRVSPPCPYFGPDRCGGCQLQHIAPDRQAALKRQVVVDALERLGRIERPAVSETVRAGDFGYRNQARFAVDPQGRLGFRSAASHDVVPIGRCLLLDEATQDLRDEAGDSWAGSDEIVVRTGVGADGTLHESLEPADPAVVVHRVGELSFQVSPGSFFQANTEGAGTLLRLVRAAAGISPGDQALDLYAGVGLFSAGLAADGAEVLAVEANPVAAADAIDNLAALPVTVTAEPAADAVAKLLEQELPVDVVVLDPPRQGAGEDLSAALARLGARRVIYVACDPAALGRDARVLTAHGYTLHEAVPVDQFAQTAHVEVVATFDRAPGPGLQDIG
jgi:tRNA/tmRNA/rRNA uracil-C5-methylase (TrmA/RlmC/RlmD family)